MIEEAAEEWADALALPEDGYLPTPRSIAAQLKQQLNDAVLAERQRRGVITDPADTYQMHRALSLVVETCEEYAGAFRTAAKEARAVAEEELCEAFGDQDGVPNQGITVPVPDGTEIKVALDIRNSWSADADAIMAAVAYQVLRELPWWDEVSGSLDADAGVSPTAETESVLANLMVLAMQRFAATGAYTPQVTKVKQLIAELATGDEGDRIASTVSGSLRKRQEYRGVKVERVQPKRRPK